ncbi:hypothetical protein NXF25_013813, partial [Crotalus adamanteus]
TYLIRSNTFRIGFSTAGWESISFCAVDSQSKKPTTHSESTQSL